MRKITLALAIALAFAGSAVSTADAQTTRGANDIAGAAQNFSPTSRRPAADGAPIAGRDSCARAAASAAGVVPAGKGDCKGEAAARGLAVTLIGR
jgi:hypothetical protein